MGCKAHEVYDSGAADEVADSSAGGDGGDDDVFWL